MKDVGTTIVGPIMAAGMNQHERIETLQQYETGHTLLGEALKEFPTTMWKYKPASNKWSIHEIVIHLADSEIQSHVRCRMIIANRVQRS